MRQMFILISAISFLSLSSFAQSVKDRVDQHAKDPKTVENAAKADVYLQRNKIMNDSVPMQKKGPQLTTDSRKKEKRYKRKGKK